MECVSRYNSKTVFEESFVSRLTENIGRYCSPFIAKLVNSPVVKFCEHAGAAKFRQGHREFGSKTIHILVATTEALVYESLKANDPTR
jgi:hypothetical protein